MQSGSRTALLLVLQLLLAVAPMLAALYFMFMPSAPLLIRDVAYFLHACFHTPGTRTIEITFAFYVVIFTFVLVNDAWAVLFPRAWAGTPWGLVTMWGGFLVQIVVLFFNDAFEWLIGLLIVYLVLNAAFARLSPNRWKASRWTVGNWRGNRYFAPGGGLLHIRVYGLLFSFCTAVLVYIGAQGFISEWGWMSEATGCR